MSQTSHAESKNLKLFEEYVLFEGDDFKAPLDGVFVPQDVYREYRVNAASIKYLESIDYCHEDSSYSFDGWTFFGGGLMGAILTTLAISAASK